MGFSIGDLAGLAGGISNPTALIGPGISILGSLFGGHGASSAGKAAFQEAQRNASQLSSVGDQYNQNAALAGSEFSPDNAGYRGAVSNEANYLQQNPFTSQYDTQSLANATSGAANAYQKANTQLTNNLASRGITDGSALSGGLASIGNAQAAQQAGAQNALAQRQIATANQNRNSLVSLLGGEANQDYSRQNNALGHEGSIDQDMFGDNSHLGEGEYTRANAQQAQTNQMMAGIGSGLSDALDTSPDPNDALSAYYYKMAGLDKNGDPLTGGDDTPTTSPALLGYLPMPAMSKKGSDDSGDDN